MAEAQTFPVSQDRSIFLPKSSKVGQSSNSLLGAGLVFLTLALILGRNDHENLLFSYHVAYIYFLTLALGGLLFVLIQFATKAGWSVILRRYAENIASTIPLFVILFIPIIFGLHTLFHHWVDADVVAKDIVLQKKAAYLNVPFFYVRAAIFFVAWTFLAKFFQRNSLAQDASGDEKYTYKMQNLSYPGIAIFAITTTFASIDWVKSLNPHWPSTMFGVYFFAGILMASFASLIVVSNIFGKANTHYTAEHNHDLGKLLFGFTVFWTYIAFSQFFLVWYANMPEETKWYEARFHGGWLSLSIFLAIGHFVVPMLFLIRRGVKRNKKLLLVAASWMLFMHLIDIYWLIMPTHYPEGPELGVLHILTFLGVGCLFLGVALKPFGKHSIIPSRDPRLSESISFENF